MKKYISCFIILLFVIWAQAQPTLQDTLSALSHDHTPIFTGSGDESIVCYKSSHRNFFFAITGLIVAIALLLLKLFFFNRRTNRTLKRKNAIIEEKNKNITDSINYAKRLQNAILPADELINKALPEHFILYMPKDIVSGDFYWVSEHGNKVVVAAMDCTGHGVPGALLSIVGHNANNKTINELGITQPSEVMLSMNAIIKKVLHQDEGSNIKDGMDMAMFTYDRITGMLQYAGANNPLYIVSDKKLNIIKASKLTVGTVEEHTGKLPENHSIQLKKGDCVYVFSDGFADQFGGKKGKKYKTSRLQELLISLGDSEMKEQGERLQTAFKDWKGDNEQVDDVLLIGVRV